MANITIPSLPAGAPATSDLIVVSQGGVVRSVTAAQQITLFGQNVFSSLAVDPTPDPAADYFLTWDNSASAAKKALMSTLPASESAIGLVELASAAEILAGTSTTLAMTPGAFAANGVVADNSYYRLPGGLLLQWGSFATASGSGNIAHSFPTSFANVWVVLPVGSSATSGSSVRIIPGSISTTGFSVRYDSGTSGIAGTCYYLAIGN